MTTRARFSAVSSSMLALGMLACTRTPPETLRTPEEKSEAAPPSIPSAAPSAMAGEASPPSRAKGADPTGGKFTLEEATDGLAGSGGLLAKMETTKGLLTCTLFEDKAPVSVANFVGLARGKRPFRDPSTREWVHRPAYDGTTFHRIIKGFMIQGGDAKGDGTGEPGYVIPDEIWTGSKHDRAGLLCMANRGANTNGQQFFITDGAAKHLDGGYTIFGECTPTALVTTIASGKTDEDQAKEPVVIKKVTIEREKPGKGAGKDTTKDAGK